MKRKVYLFLATILCFFALTACGSKEEADAGYDETVVEQVAREAVDEWSSDSALAELMGEIATDEGAAKYKEDILASYEAMGMSVTEEQEKSIDEMISVLQGWSAVEKETGKLTALEDKKAEFSEADNAKYVNVKLEAKCEKGRMYVTVPVLKKATLNAQQLQYDMFSLKLEEIKTMGEKMSKAGLNTLMGVGLVFVLLIVICLLISTFGIFGKFGKKKEEPKKEVSAPVAAAAPVPVVEEELVDDTELVAVITAAIMASMGDEVPADGLVVRSIRRRR